MVRPMARRPLVALALVAVIVLVPASARAGDQAVLRTTTTLLPRAAATSLQAAGGSGGADAVQRQYDAARDLQAALSAAAPASPACVPLATALSGYAAAQVAAAEGFDRLRPTATARAVAAAASALARVQVVRPGCAAHPGRTPPMAVTAQVDDPASFEAFSGAVRTRAPRTAVSATVSFRGRIVARAEIEGGWLRTRISARPARGNLVVAFLSSAGAPLGSATSRAVWLLPQSAAVAAASVGENRRIDTALSHAVSSLTGIGAVSTLDLTTGERGGWNDTARFPAASTVKLAVLTAALKRFGPRPEEHPSFYDLQAVTGWSSNLAANRLMTQLGGAEAVQAELRRLGARSSTYPGNYVAGTAFTREPPPVSRRLTTARDLAAVLATLQRAALGQPRSGASSGLTIHEARVALGLLLSSQATGDNAGMLRTALGPGVPIAQKQGWLDDVRITAAIVYTTRGPRIVVICAYAQNLALRTATALGRRVVAALDLR
jgi:beta-lactamase class A